MKQRYVEKVVVAKDERGKLRYHDSLTIYIYLITRLERKRKRKLRNNIIYVPHSLLSHDETTKNKESEKLIYIIHSRWSIYRNGVGFK